LASEFSVGYILMCMNDADCIVFVLLVLYYFGSAAGRAFGLK